MLRAAELAAQPWRASPYYDRAEKRLEPWWGARSVFPPLFAQLDLTHIVDLACRHGRHTDQLRTIEHSRVIGWGGVPDLGRVVMLQR